MGLKDRLNKLKGQFMTRRASDQDGITKPVSGAEGKPGNRNQQILGASKRLKEEEQEKKKKICRKMTGLILCCGLGYACCCSLSYPDWFRTDRKDAPLASRPCRG